MPNTRSGISGSRATLPSTYTNAASSATPSAIGASTPAEPQPSVSVRTIAYTSAVSAPVTSSAPEASKCRFAVDARPAGIMPRPYTITPRPIGTFTRKIAGQPNACVSTPPSSTPSEPPTPPIAPHTPSARLRSRPSVNEVAMIARLAGEITAPPMPCSARAPISSVRESASAHASDASANSAVPARNTRRRPSRSAARPPSSRKPANVSVYAFTTHCRPVVEKRSPSRIDGSATFTIDTSRITISCARQTRTSSAREPRLPAVRALCVCTERCVAAGFSVRVAAIALSFVRKYGDHRSKSSMSVVQ